MYLIIVIIGDYFVGEGFADKHGIILKNVDNLQAIKVVYKVVKISS